MGTTLKDVKKREMQYRRGLQRESVDKAIHICTRIIPALIRAIFDSTVRFVDVDICRPCKEMISNNIEELEDGSFKIHDTDLRDKAVYFEELLKWN